MSKKGARSIVKEGLLKQRERLVHKETLLEEEAIRIRQNCNETVRKFNAVIQKAEYGIGLAKRNQHEKLDKIAAKKRLVTLEKTRVESSLAALKEHRRKEELGDVITDHFLARWFERVEDGDIEQIREWARTILDSVTPPMAERKVVVSINNDAYEVVVSGGLVRTIYKPYGEKE